MNGGPVSAELVCGYLACDAKPFNPLLVPAPDLAAKPRLVGGVGLHFVRKLTDHLEYTRREGINELRFAKKLKESPA